MDIFKDMYVPPSLDRVLNRYRVAYKYNCLIVKSDKGGYEIVGEEANTKRAKEELGIE